MPFEFEPQAIPQVVLVKPHLFSDERGMFAELYKASEFNEYGFGKQFLQINFSKSEQGVVRALHYQLHPKAQGKLVMVTSGEIFDVAVDLRKSSPTFQKWVGVTLSAVEKHMLFVPVGFAHGFGVLSEQAEVMYFTTEEYAPEYERGIQWNDPAINISWPVQKPVLSEKDAAYPPLDKAEHNFS